MPLRDGIGFLAFDALVAKCIPGTTTRDARIRQIVAAHALGGFMQRWDATDRRGDPSPGSNGEDVETEFGTFQPAQARFSPSASAVFRALRMGLLALGAALSATMFPARRRVSGSYAIVIGTSASDCIRDGSDKRFVEFCRHGPVSRLHSPTRLFVQSAHGGISSSDPQIEYSPRPLYGLLRSADLTVLARLRLGMLLLVRANQVLLGTCEDRQAALLARDVIESEVVCALVRAGKLERVLFTNSSASSQPLWVRSRAVPCSMIWYSENSKWLWHVAEREAELPIYRHLCIEEHWVWTESHSRWLRSLGHSGPIHVVGPIVWNLSKRTERSDPAPIAWITVFDIAPVTPSRAREIGFVDNYYACGACVAFLRGVVEAVERQKGNCRISVCIRIKPKRIQPHMDRAYADELDALVKKGAVEVMDPKVDLFDLVRSSALSIVQPFSSPALVAAHMKARACYFDASARLRIPEHLDPAIMFVQDVSSLERVIFDAVMAKSADRPATIPS
jgi:hypothetical protein